MSIGLIERFINYLYFGIYDLQSVHLRPPASTLTTSSQYTYYLQSVHFRPPVSTLTTSSQYTYYLQSVHFRPPVSTLTTSSQYTYDLQSVHLRPPVSTLTTSSQYTYDLQSVHLRPPASTLTTSSQYTYDLQSVHLRPPASTFKRPPVSTLTTSSQYTYDLQSYTYDLHQYTYDLQSVHLRPPVSTLTTSQKYTYDLQPVHLRPPVSTLTTSSQYTYDLQSVHLLPPVSTFSTSSQYTYDLQPVHLRPPVSTLTTSSQYTYDLQPVHLRPPVSTLTTSSQYTYDLQSVHLRPPVKQCSLKGVVYDHGESVSPRQCVDCECHDGKMQCRRVDPEAARSLADDPFCPHCNCWVTVPRDIDECQEVGAHHGHYCQAHTHCVNTVGSYVCQCHDGYVREDELTCVERDECAQDANQCHQHASCTNTPGGYRCECLPGFTGDGFNCKPVCNSSCENGGVCVAPGQCQCRRGFSGERCQLDVDECAMNLHQCHANSRCVNLPGWYTCHCLPGYTSLSTDNNHGLLCQDVDECSAGTATCHESATCVNTEGSFLCSCDNGTVCSHGCVVHGLERANGDVWSPPGVQCSQCTCTEGTVTCHRSPCDCSDDSLDTVCCPQCDVRASCTHQVYTHLVYTSGQRWLYQCQTCECLKGETDCWPLECPPVHCSSPQRVPGDCCARCPDDPCKALDANTSLGSTGNSSSPQGCHYMGAMYPAGAQWAALNDDCVTCRCQMPYCWQGEGRGGALRVHRTDRCVVVTAAAVWVIGTGVPFQLSRLVLRGLGTLHLLALGLVMCFVAPLFRCFAALWRLLLQLQQLLVTTTPPSGKLPACPTQTSCPSPELPAPRRPPDLTPTWWWVPTHRRVALPRSVTCLRHLPWRALLVIVTLQRLAGRRTLGTAVTRIEMPSGGTDLAEHNYSGSPKMGSGNERRKAIRAQETRCFSLNDRTTSLT
nr:uncharacterized protein LOC128701029 [Cherax quadricarinatus]